MDVAGYVFQTWTFEKTYVAGTKHTRFGLPYKLLHQNEIVPFFMDEKRNVAYVYYWFLGGVFF